MKKLNIGVTIVVIVIFLICKKAIIVSSFLRMEPVLQLAMVIAVIQMIFILLSYFISKGNRFISSIDIVASSNAGKTYSRHLTGITISKVIYIKVILQVKTTGFWHLLFDNKVMFSIKHPSYFKPSEEKEYNDIMYTCELFDYSLCQYTEDKQSFAENSTREFNVTLVEKNTNTNCQYDVSISGIKRITHNFSMLASKRSQKTEIVFKLVRKEKLEGQSTVEDNAFIVSFADSIHKTYTRKARLGFINSVEECI